MLTFFLFIRLFEHLLLCWYKQGTPGDIQDLTYQRRQLRRFICWVNAT